MYIGILRKNTLTSFKLFFPLLIIATIKRNSVKAIISYGQYK